jgi:pre-mRNA-splicing factor SYF1
MYADFEENYGLISHAMEVYDKAIKEISDKEHQFEMFNLYIAKATKYYGVTYTRQLY